MKSLKRIQHKYLQFLIYGAVLTVILPQAALAGCLCNSLASYIDCGGTIISVSFIASAFLMFRKRNLQVAKKMVLAGASLITLTVGISTSLNSSLWYSPGVIANSEAWLEGGCPAHWISLLIIAIVFGLLFVCCSLVPTIVAYRRQLENKRSICKMNLMVLLIPGAFVMAPFLFFDLGSYLVMAFWTALFTDPKSLSQFPPFFYFSIFVWSVLLGVFAWAWSGLLVDACKSEVLVAETT